MPATISFFRCTELTDAIESVSHGAWTEQNDRYVDRGSRRTRRLRLRDRIRSRIILLTIFVKTRQRERHEVDRARRAMQTCIDDDHTLDDD